MKHHFLWTDLSSYDIPAAVDDYAALFGWQVARSGDYRFAAAGDTTVVAIFQMRDFLAKIDMPSFWTSYVHVDNLEATPDKVARHENAIIEVKPQPYDAAARVALVRDPSGAGFTLYEGPEIAAPFAPAPEPSRAACTISRTST